MIFNYDYNSEGLYQDNLKVFILLLNLLSNDKIEDTVN